jgi:hypothetical protein
MIETAKAFLIALAAFFLAFFPATSPLSPLSTAFYSALYNRSFVKGGMPPKFYLFSNKYVKPTRYSFSPFSSEITRSNAKISKSLSIKIIFLAV